MVKRDLLSIADLNGTEVLAVLDDRGKRLGWPCGTNHEGGA